MQTHASKQLREAKVVAFEAGEREEGEGWRGRESGGSREGNKEDALYALNPMSERNEDDALYALNPKPYQFGRREGVGRQRRRIGRQGGMRGKRKRDSEHCGRARRSCRGYRKLWRPPSWPPGRPRGCKPTPRPPSSACSPRSAPSLWLSFCQSIRAVHRPRERGGETKSVLVMERLRCNLSSIGLVRVGRAAKGELREREEGKKKRRKS